MEICLLPYCCTFRRSVIDVLFSQGYIGEFEIIDDHRAGKIVVNLTGRINKVNMLLAVRFLWASCFVSTLAFWNDFIDSGVTLFSVIFWSRLQIVLLQLVRAVLMLSKCIFSWFIITGLVNYKYSVYGQCDCKTVSQACGSAALC